MMSDMPVGDVWTLVDNKKNSARFGESIRFDFSYIIFQDIQAVVKMYIWINYKKETKSLNTLRKDISKFKIFISFAQRFKVDTFKNLNNNDIANYLSYLKTYISLHKKPLTYNTQKNYLDGLKAIIRFGQLYLPQNVTAREIFTGNEYRGADSKLKIEYIPDDIVNKINKGLLTEENPHLKYGIIVLQATGLRLIDLLLLKVDCLKPHPITKHETINYYNHKARKFIPYLPIPPQCTEAIQHLKQHQDGLIQDYLSQTGMEIDKSIKELLFLHIRACNTSLNRGQLGKLVYDTFNNWLKSFIKRNNIEDSNGNLYNLSSHQFRRTLGTDMFSKGIDITVIQEVLGHADPATTRRFYADIKDKERAEVAILIGIIGVLPDINLVDEKIIPDKENLQWFRENMHKGARMCDGYCTQPFKEGNLCDVLVKRKKCYTCGRYITTPEYLNDHKNHLRALEEELQGNIYGEHYANHLIPTIAILKEIIIRLEEIKC